MTVNMLHLLIHNKDKEQLRMIEMSLVLSVFGFNLKF